MMTVATQKYGSPEFDYPPVDMEVIYDETPIDENVDLEADVKTKDNKENNDAQDDKAKKDIIETFKTIPVQLSAPLDIFKRKSKEKDADSVQEHEKLEEQNKEEKPKEKEIINVEETQQEVIKEDVSEGKQEESAE
jgi:hypothetical protein